MRIVQYSPEMEPAWNAFVATSKNATFLHDRHYMDYHSHRFEDHSLVLLDNEDQFLALLPAEFSEGRLRSHGGLTYGGLLMGERLKTAAVLQIFTLLDQYCQDTGISRLEYKAIPHFYHRIPSEEDLYALHRNGYELVRREISSVFHLQRSQENSKKARGARRGFRAGLSLRESDTSHEILKIMNVTLKEKYGIESVHTAAEMDLLESRFPKNIKLHELMLDNQVVGGTIVYLNRKTVHIQYLALDTRTTLLRGLDFLISSLINMYRADYEWLDYGISTEDEGRILNTGLIHAKEGFNFRGCCYDTYAKNFGMIS